MTTKKRSLAVYLPSLASGGAEKLHIILAPAFMEAGYDVSFVLHYVEGAYVAAVPPGVRIVELGSRRTLGCFMPLIKYLKKEKPDILLSNLGHNNILAIWAGAIARVPTKIIATHHSALSSECRTTYNWQYRVLPFLCRLFLPWADGNVAVSSGAADDISITTGLARDKVTVIYNPVELKDFEARSKEPVSHPWFQDGLAPVVLAVGRLTNQKNFQTLIKAFAKVVRERQARLVFVGEGPLRQELQELAASLGVTEYIDFAGFQTNPMAFMAKARLLAASSIYEGFGNVLVEALACGTPVVSTNCPFGPAEILEHGIYGKLVPVGDDDALAKAIVSTLDETPDRDMLHARGREFTVERTANGYLQLFDDLLAK
ncbi:MAG: glycosyltransferase [Rickettsiales bacterium]